MNENRKLVTLRKGRLFTTLSLNTRIGSWENWTRVKNGRHDRVGVGSEKKKFFIWLASLASTSAGLELALLAFSFACIEKWRGCEQSSVRGVRMDRRTDKNVRTVPWQPNFGLHLLPRALHSTKNSGLNFPKNSWREYGAEFSGSPATPDKQHFCSLGIFQ